MLDFLFGSSYNPDTAIPSLEGKVVLITGGLFGVANIQLKARKLTLQPGNTGLGKETVLQLAKHNPKEIFLAARTPSKAEAAIEDIKKSVPNGNITFIQLDLTSLQSVKTAAEEFKSRSDRLDVLINNADE
jgi:NAD(P)-dependent dehydrogenase (short-subunit alcohol dehydrogenase family)